MAPWLGGTLWDWCLGARGEIGYFNQEKGVGLGIVFRPQSFFEVFDKGGVHEGVNVGDVEYTDSFGFELWAKERVQSVFLAAFHDVDMVGPFDVIQAERFIGVIAETCKIGLDIWPICEQCCGCGAAHACFATKKKDVDQTGFSIVISVGRRALGSVISAPEGVNLNLIALLVWPWPNWILGSKGRDLWPQLSDLRFRARLARCDR